MNIHGGGPMKIRLFAEGGSFTCIMQGSGSVGGEMKRGKARVVMGGGFSTAGESCSGTFDAETGRLVGKGKLRNKLAATMTLHDGHSAKPVENARNSNKRPPGSWRSPAAASPRRHPARAARARHGPKDRRQPPPRRQRASPRSMMPSRPCRSARRCARC